MRSILKAKIITPPASAKNTEEVIYKSVITCPVCSYQEEEVMPIDACQFFYECKNCHTVLKPKAGDCCVYCSYGSKKCPSKQLNVACC